MWCQALQVDRPGCDPQLCPHRLHGLGQGAPGSEPRFPLLCNGLIADWKGVGGQWTHAPGAATEDGFSEVWPPGQAARTSAPGRSQGPRRAFQAPEELHRERQDLLTGSGIGEVGPVLCLPEGSVTKPSFDQAQLRQPRLGQPPGHAVPGPPPPPVTCLACALNGAPGPTCWMGHRVGVERAPQIAVRQGYRPSEPSWRACVGRRVDGGGVVGGRGHGVVVSSTG